MTSYSKLKAKLAANGIDLLFGNVDDLPKIIKQIEEENKENLPKFTSFEFCLYAMKQGQPIKRSIWNDVSLFIRGENIYVDTGLDIYKYEPVMEDIMADDWEIIK